jgi:hypothetical protein
MEPIVTQGLTKRYGDLAAVAPTTGTATCPLGMKRRLGRRDIL